MLALLSFCAKSLLLSIMHFLGLKAKTALFFYKMKMDNVNFFLKIGATDSTQKGSIWEIDISIFRGTLQSFAFI